MTAGEGSLRDFLVPDLGEGLEDATVIGWSVAVGDEVELNQTLCTLETAKAQVEIPSPYAGRIAELGGAEGDVLPVGGVLVRIDTGAAAPSSSATPPAAPAAGPSPARSPVLVGYGADAGFDTSRRRDGRPRAKPSVRKLAAELGVDLAGLSPDADGVISREAVLAAADGPRATPMITSPRCVACKPRWPNGWPCRAVRFLTPTAASRWTARGCWSSASAWV